jgi:hypothetical protein
VFVDLDVACPIPKSTAGGTITPASGPNDHWLVKYSGNTTTTDTITFTCDAKPGGTAKFDIRVDDIKYSASLSVTGPKQ